MKKTLMQKFSTRSGNDYIYDVNTGTVIPDNSILGNILEMSDMGMNADDIRHTLLIEFRQDLVDSTLRFFDRWVSTYDGFYMKEKNESLTDYSSMKKTLTSEYDKGTTYLLVLNVTENCNFRCRYCYLSEEYDFTRNRTENVMPFETAKKPLTDTLII